MNSKWTPILFLKMAFNLSVETLARFLWIALIPTSGAYSGSTSTTFFVRFTQPLIIKHRVFTIRLVQWLAWVFQTKERKNETRKLRTIRQCIPQWGGHRAPGCRNLLYDSNLLQVPYLRLSRRLRSRSVHNLDACKNNAVAHYLYATKGNFRTLEKYNVQRCCFCKHRSRTQTWITVSSTDWS